MKTPWGSSNVCSSPNETTVPTVGPVCRRHRGSCQRVSQLCCCLMEKVSRNAFSLSARMTTFQKNPMIMCSRFKSVTVAGMFRVMLPGRFRGGPVKVCEITNKMSSGARNAEATERPARGACVCGVCVTWDLVLINGTASSYSLTR